jgi:hypothetical protein
MRSSSKGVSEVVREGAERRRQVRRELGVDAWRKFLRTVVLEVEKGRRDSLGGLEVEA